MTELHLRHLDQNLWVIDHPFKALGAHLGTRTSVIRRDDGSLWLLSPGEGLAALQAELEALGPVQALVAPNAMHHLYLPATARLFPAARIYGPPGLKAKQPDLSYTLLKDAAWAEIGVLPIRGLGMLQENVFLHAPSRTLLVTDLVFHIRESGHTWTRLFMALNGGYGRFGPSRILRSLIKDRRALGESLETLLTWDFDRVVMAHGQVLETDGKARLREAFAEIGILEPVPAH